MVLGASPNPVRFSHKAVKSLLRNEQEVVAVAYKEGLFVEEEILPLGRSGLEATEEDGLEWDESGKATARALLGSMVSLTPGTTTIDIDMERKELLLHVLDASDTDAVVAGIRRDFEPGLRALFGREMK